MTTLIGNIFFILALIVMIGGFLIVSIKEKKSFLYLSFITSILLLGIGMYIMN